MSYSAILKLGHTESTCIFSRKIRSPEPYFQMVTYAEIQTKKVECPLLDALQISNLNFYILYKNKTKHQFCRLAITLVPCVFQHFSKCQLQKSSAFQPMKRSQKGQGCVQLMTIGYFNDGLRVNCKTTPTSRENSQGGLQRWVKRVSSLGTSANTLKRCYTVAVKRQQCLTAPLKVKPESFSKH